MRRITRALAAASLAALVGAGTAACSSEPGGDGAQPAGTSAAPTTTSSAPVPGPEGAPVDVPAAVAERWNSLGGEAGVLGRAAGPATAVAGGSVTDFERGTVVLTPAGRAFVVQGEILTAYREQGGPAGALGFPTSDETTTDGGWVSAFENGSIAYVDGRPVVETR